jgi:hypothetical protein
MAYVNFISNLAGLFFWFSWISIRYSTLGQPTGVSLAGTLRRAESERNRQWGPIFILGGIIFFRAIFFYLAQSRMYLDLGIIEVGFRAVPGARFLGQMLLFSTLSFVEALACAYSWLTLLSSVNFQMPDGDPIQKAIRLHYKYPGKLPRFVKLLLPFFIGMIVWLALQPLLVHFGISLPLDQKIKYQVLKQSVWIGLSAYLFWKYLIVGILLLHLLGSYVHLGRHPFWNFIHTTARNLLLPLSWLPLKAGRVDLVPVFGIALVFLASEVFSRIAIVHPEWMPF